jgi:uncharacterized protein YjdB
MTLLPASLSGGFTMSFAAASETGTLTSDKPQTIKRSVFGTLKNIDSKVSEWESSIVEPEYVDLGLSVKWATFNVGASKPEEYGDLFAWGETKPKATYDWSTYNLSNGRSYSHTKYCPSDKSDYWGGSGSPDNKTVLDFDDDAANVNWGESWRMPTDTEWTELRENCTWTWTDDYNGTGIAGQIVTSKKAGYTNNSIFLPAAGLQNGTSLLYVGSIGYYWSSSLYTYSPNGAWLALIHPTAYGFDSYSRECGRSVRPVYGEFLQVSSITLDYSSLELMIGDSAQLNATISPYNATAPSVYWVSGDESIVFVDQEGKVSAFTEGSTTIAAYASNGLSATCMVTVNNNLSKPDSVEAVDLGLPSGLKWASCNVGATKPEEYGAYFAWGETEPKDKYIWSNYKFELGTLNYGPFSKYVTNSSYGTLDNKTVLDTEDDAASANWGGNWRMPTDAEWTELRNNCSSEWKENNNGTGINGFLVTGPNNKSIFLPAAGYLRSTSTLGNVAGYYCSSSLDKDGPSEAWLVDFYPNTTSRGTGARCYGYPVRPVYGEFIPVESISLDNSSLELIVGDSAQLSATISPSNATEPSVRWESGDESIVSVDKSGNISALSEGSTTVTSYSSNGLSASCMVTVSEEPVPEAVDLGLPSGVKWATCNLGATKPEEDGDLFAWGELTPKQEYSWQTYKWCNGTYNSLTKYCHNCGYDGFTDNKGVLDIEDDAAAVALGKGWRIPTYSESIELFNNCTFRWTSLNGKTVCKVTSKIEGYTDKCIYIPLTGQNIGGDYYFANWTSTLHSVSYDAWEMSDQSIYWCADRNMGLQIRPIFAK